jgi:uncharacterized membrane protein
MLLLWAIGSKVSYGVVVPTMHADQILGLEVPSTAPLFLIVLAVHLPAGVLTVVSGAVTALSEKGSSRHVRAGRLYLRCLWVVAVTALVLAVIRWPHDVHLLVLGGLALFAAVTGRRLRRRPAHAAHILAMGASYTLMLTAFYVDNGPHLPLWNHLPDAVFWIGPTLIAIPLMIRATRRHRQDPSRSPAG